MLSIAEAEKKQPCLDTIFNFLFGRQIDLQGYGSSPILGLVGQYQNLAHQEGEAQTKKERFQP